MTRRTDPEVGALIKARRLELGMTPADLRAATKIDDKTLSTMESGERWPQARTRLAVEKALSWRAGSIEMLRAGEEPQPIINQDAQDTQLQGSGNLSATVQVGVVLLSQVPTLALIDEIRRRVVTTRDEPKGPGWDRLSAHDEASEAMRSDRSVDDPNYAHQEGG